MVVAEVGFELAICDCDPTGLGCVRTSSNITGSAFAIRRTVKKHLHTPEVINIKSAYLCPRQDRNGGFCAFEVLIIQGTNKKLQKGIVFSCVLWYNNGK